MFGKSPVLIGIVICISLLQGCDGSRPKEVAATAAEKQRSHLLRMVEKDYRDTDSHYQLGKLYQAEGLWAQAEHEFTVTLGFDPVHRPAQAARVKVLMDSGDTQEAKLSTDFYMNQASTTAAGSLELAMAFQKEGLDEYAYTCYQKALNLAPTSAKINRQIGYYYLSKGDTDRGKDYLVRSFQLNPNQPEVAGALGRLGVAVTAGQKTQRNAKSLDKTIDSADKGKLP